MDYKEMISALEGYFNGKDLKRGDALRIADAMKTLLAERDAAIEQIRGECRLCSNVRKCYSDDEMMRDCARNNRRNWQWSGPQKGENND